MRICKTPFFAAVIISLAACSTNPATGARQFTGLMSPGQESSVGASEHQKVEQQFGFYNDPKLTAYVNEVGNKVTKDTERADVQYKFYVIDSPIVNAFALPGGYIYVSRGLAGAWPTARPNSPPCSRMKPATSPPATRPSVIRTAL
jgi:predicted Zn-dependent protease